jgi:hypothetical protein
MFEPLLRKRSAALESREGGKKAYCDIANESVNQSGSPPHCGTCRHSHLHYADLIPERMVVADVLIDCGGMDPGASLLCWFNHFLVQAPE